MNTFKKNIYRATTTAEATYPTLSVPTACFPGSPDGTVRISGGVNGDTIIVRILYSGIVETTGASASVSATATINGGGAASVCYGANTGAQAFSLDGNVVIVLTGSPMDVSTSIYYRNGTGFILTNKYVQIISYNGVTVNGAQLSDVCSGNDSGAGC